MKIILAIPSNTLETSGNWVTARRLAEELREAGHSPRVARADELSLADLEQATLVHCLHAYKSGWMLLPLLERSRVPLVVTFTGTDLGELLEGSEQGALIRRALPRVAAAIVFYPAARDSLLASAGMPPERVWIIPQSPDRFPAAWSREEARRQWGLQPGSVVFLWAGGIRPVKQPLNALELLRRLAGKYPQLNLILAGPVLDPDLGRELALRLAGVPWARYLGEVPHQDMPSLYLAADVVFNTSQSEGMSNALLEAMSLGRAVLAADIPGNRSLVLPEESGLLFGPDNFEAQAERFLNSPGLRRSLGEGAKALVEKTFSRQREIEAYLEVYQRCLEEKAR